MFKALQAPSDGVRATGLGVNRGRARVTRQLAGAAVLIAILSGCGGPVTRGPADLEMRLIVEPDPPIVGGAQLRIDVTDLKWTPVNGVSVSVTGIRMDERGEPFQAAAVARGAGQYIVPRFEFEASGAWTLTIRADIAGGDWLEIDHVVTVEPSEH